MCLAGLDPRQLICSLNISNTGTEHAERQVDQQGSKDIERNKTVKRKVAMHVGYVGTAFRGLQFQRDSKGGEQSIEHVLEQAIYKAGLLLGTNVGQSHRTGWSRSSRTDAGVHSLSTVAALKMEVQEGQFEDDHEGQVLTAAINAHLPAEVRVFSVQRTHNAFNARQHCRSRAYHYYLPAAALGLAMDGGEEDAQIMARLHNCMALYKGSHAFHNHTVRKRYRRETRSKLEAKAKAVWERHHRNSESTSESKHRSENNVSAAASNVAEVEAAYEAKNDADEAVPTPGVNGAEQEEADDAAVPGGVSGAFQKEAAAEPRPHAGNSSSFAREELRPLHFWWKHEPDEQDAVSDAHYRHILDAQASEPLQLTPDGQHCIRVSLHGSSFMVYQIRHMVAMATLVALGRVPLLFLEAIMCPNARALLPLSPPGVLVLEDSTFFPFPDVGKNAHPVTRISGPALRLRGAGSAAREDFSTKVLQPALSKIVEEAQCKEWCKQIQTVQPKTGAMVAFLDSYTEWKARRDEVRAERQALRALEESA